MRCKFCAYEAVAAVRHWGPEGRWFRREELDPVCATHKIRLAGYFGATIEAVPRESVRAACLRILGEIREGTASEIAEILRDEGGVSRSVSSALYQLYLREKVHRKKTNGYPGNWRDQKIYTYSLEEL